MGNGDYESKIIECPACRNGISRRAMMCPTCGHDMRPRGPSNPKLLKYCPACGIAIGTKAFRCPNCGQRQMSNWQITRLVINILLIPFLIYLMVCIIGAIIYCITHQ